MRDDWSWFVYVVYEHPTDAPDDFVIRKWECRAQEPKALEVVAQNPSYDVAIAQLHEKVPGLACVLPDKDDDPKVKEVWL